MNIEELNSIFSLHLGVGDLRLILKPEWSSQEKEHRQLLRNAIYGYLEIQGGDAADRYQSVTDLAELPEAEGHSISISHCKRVGGFVVAPRCKIVGFDIEINRRLDGVRLGLVSVDDGELQDAPNPAAFWTAKEAAFKCLRGPGQPRGLKDIRVGDWKEVGSGVHRFDVIEVDDKTTNEIVGLVVDDGEMSYAVCVRRDSRR